MLKLHESIILLNSVSLKSIRIFLDYHDGCDNPGPVVADHWYCGGIAIL